MINTFLENQAQVAQLELSVVSAFDEGVLLAVFLDVLVTVVTVVLTLPPTVVVIIVV